MGTEFDQNRRTLLKTGLTLLGAGLVSGCNQSSGQLRTIGLEDPTIPAEVVRVLDEITGVPLLPENRFSADVMHSVAAIRSNLGRFLKASSAESVGIRLPSLLYMRGVVLSDPERSVTIYPYFSYRPHAQEMGVLFGTHNMVTGLSFHTPRTIEMGRREVVRSFEFAQTPAFTKDHFSPLLGTDLSMLVRANPSLHFPEVIKRLESILCLPNQALFVSESGQAQLRAAFVHMQRGR